MTEDEIRCTWLARLGRPVALDFAFLAVGDAFPQAADRTVALGELGAGRVVPGDRLEAVGLAPAPVPVRVARVEQPAPGGGVTATDAGEAGQVLGLTLEHAPGAAIVPGQCLAPPGRLALAAAVAAEAWILPAGDLPGSPLEQRRLLEAAAEGRDLELVFHSHPVAARPAETWRPELGAEYRIAFDLAHPVALYPDTRFALRHTGLTFGAGIVLHPRSN